MNFLTFLSESILLEGGAAIKGAERITQVEARHHVPELISKIARVTGISEDKIKLVGSAGKKPGDNETSGDIDIVISCDAETIKSALPKLSYDGETHKAMLGINVFSFGTKVNGKVIQVDVIPVENIDFAVWSYISDPKDLAKGLKGSQRNEVIFAICKNATDNKKTKNDDGEVIAVERLFFDMSKGLMSGEQSRMSKKGKLGKNFSTVSDTKHVVTSDPKEICTRLFGKKYSNPSKMTTFSQLWDAINDDNFPHKENLEDIIEMTKKGITNKNLKMPQELQ